MKITAKSSHLDKPGQRSQYVLRHSASEVHDYQKVQGIKKIIPLELQKVLEVASVHFKTDSSAQHGILSNKG